MNYTKAFYNIGLIGNNFAWETVLTQEGVFFDVVSNLIDLKKYNIIIVTSKSQISYNTVYDFAKNGGMVLIETDIFSKITYTKAYYKKVRYLIPQENSLFSEIGLIDIDNEIYFLQDKNYLDENLKIAFEKVGKGFLYFFPFTLSNVFSNHKYSRKKFYDKRKELPSEDVSNVSKYKFLKIISISLSALFHKIKLPFVTKWYYPNSKKSFFSFRIDTDFCSLEDAKKLYELTLKYKIPTTWFVDTSSKENLQNLYSKLPQNNEVGLHAFRHLIFRSYKENDKNINKGLEILKKYGINPNGFAAPFGEWNITLQKVIEKYFLYSSEFCFDYDNFPSYPYVAGNFSSALQIPVHPISIGRLIRSHYTKEEMIGYYFAVIDYLKSRNIPIIIYHHPHHGYFEVIEKIFKKITTDNEIFSDTMINFYKMWVNRNSERMKITVQNGKIYVDNPKGYLKIRYKNKIGLVKAEKIISNFALERVDKKEFDDDIKRIRKIHWRDYLYDFEKKKSKDRL